MGILLVPSVSSRVKSFFNQGFKIDSIMEVGYLRVDLEFMKHQLKGFQNVIEGLGILIEGFVLDVGLG
ncbi:hypothetical protein RJT34_22143 [Clitoria ternatea]|uniref:Uncharacterized protein n=1 Tax=Clitoria ternatea TaxID=43366 RepID=A0AAN9IVC2_CLITE